MHDKRIAELQQQAQAKALAAGIIEENLDAVDKAIGGVNTLLQQGVDWNDLGNRIIEEAALGNPIASAIVSLKLHLGLITLKLKHTQSVEVEPEKSENAGDIDDDDEESAESDLSDMFG